MEGFANRGVDHDGEVFVVALVQQQRMSDTGPKTVVKTVLQSVLDSTNIQGQEKLKVMKDLLTRYSTRESNW